MADLNAELIALRRRVEDLENAFKVLRSEVQKEIKEGFAGVAIQLPKMIAGSVEVALMTVKQDLVTLIAKAEAAERYRDEREERERRARAAQLDLDLKDEEVKAKRIQNFSGQHAALFIPEEQKQKRRAPVIALVMFLVTTFAGLIGAVLGSRH